VLKLNFFLAGLSDADSEESESESFYGEPGERSSPSLVVVKAIYSMLL
jgi:hypothetical protein